MSSLIASSVVQQAADLVTEVLDGKAVLYDGEGVVVLNPTASEAWLTAKDPIALEDLASTLSRADKRSVDSVLPELVALAEDLCERGLMLVQPGSS